MRVVYYGRELYHAATGAQRDNHQYIARIPVGDRFRYFYNQAELAAYNAGKAVKGTVDAAGKAIEKTGTKIKNDAYVNSIKNKYSDSGQKMADARVKAYKNAYGEKAKGIDAKATMINQDKAFNARKKALRTDAKFAKTKYDPRVDGTARDNNDDYRGRWESGSEAVETARKKAETKAHNNAPKNNQGISRIKDSGNVPKNNQGIVSKTYAEGRNRPKNNQGIAPTSNKTNNKKNYLYPEAAKLSRQGTILADKFAKSKTRYENEPSDSKTKASKLNAYVTNGERLIDNFKKTEDALNKHRGISPEKKSNAPKVSGKFLTNKGSVYDSSKISNNSISAGSGRLDNGTVDKFHVNTKAQTNKELSNAKRQKEIELSFYNSYVNDGHNSADARRWAKKAAENYMKKHK